MACTSFKESFIECLFCTDSRCKEKGGELYPHKVCTCESCALSFTEGDEVFCIGSRKIDGHYEFVGFAQKKR